jgi:hypothetical protein
MRHVSVSGARVGPGRIAGSELTHVHLEGEIGPTSLQGTHLRHVDSEKGFRIEAGSTVS